MFAQEVVGNLGITIVQSPGESPDEHANISWHWEVIDLTASQVVRLAKEIYLGAEIGRKSQIAIKGLINQGIESKQLQQGKVSSKLLQDLK